ncbi:hypothetical protein EBS02_08415, partial [bacterium]|nr:hypothetical protein [bacterium]
MAVVEKTFQLGDHQISLQTGLMARQATSSVVARMGNTMVLVTLVAQSSKEARDFFPLSVHYQSKAYAYGRVPTGFKRREGPPSESEILISRLIDRPIRPLFPAWYTDEVQIVATLLSADASVEPDVVAMIGAAAALKISGLPVNNTLGAVRVGYVNNQFVAERIGTPLALSPEQMLGAAWTWKPLRNLELLWNMQWVGRQYLDNSGDRMRSLDPYSVHQLQIQWNGPMLWNRLLKSQNES